jgi:hypothetical protein
VACPPCVSLMWTIAISPVGNVASMEVERPYRFQRQPHGGALVSSPVISSCTATTLVILQALSVHETAVMREGVSSRGPKK